VNRGRLSSALAGVIAGAWVGLAPLAASAEGTSEQPGGAMLEHLRLTTFICHCELAKQSHHDKDFRCNRG